MNLEIIRGICKKLPGVTEDIKWENHLCFCVGEKIFLMTGMDSVPVTASFKVPEEEFDELTAREGFKQAAYMAKRQWVFVDDVSRLSKKEWEQRIKTAYEIIKSKLPKKLQQSLKN